MQTLSLMPGDNFKIGDYVYITRENGATQQGGTALLKKKLSIQDRINLKLGISFDKVCPNSNNNNLYKVTMVHEYIFDNDLIEEKDFKSML